MMRPHRCSVMACGVLFLVAVCVGCATAPKKKVETYDELIIDRPTPPGEVPSAEEPVVAQPYRPDPGPAPSPGADGGGISVILPGFSSAYERAKRPRIAVYVNRTLSGEVQEWTSTRRESVGYGETVRKEEGGKTSTTTTTGGAAASTQTRTGNGQGKFIEQKWAWRLEDAIQAPLLDAGARLVDRDLIMRLAAAATPHTAYEDLAVKTIEMEALKGHADILAEVEISLTPDGRRGYLYRLRACDIDSGQVLVSKSSASWPRSRRTTGEYVATTEGYQKTAYPNPEQVGAWLAQDLMEGLAQQL